MEQQIEPDCALTRGVMVSVAKTCNIRRDAEASRKFLGHRGANTLVVERDISSALFTSRTIFRARVIIESRATLMPVAMAYH